jgi:hypothetical protein
MSGRRRNGSRRVSLKKAILFLTVFSGMTREIQGVGTAVAVPRNSLGAGRLGNRADAQPPAIFVPRNQQPGWWGQWKRTGKTIGKTVNTASVVANAALNVTAATATGAASVAQGAAHLAGAAEQAAGTLKEKAPEVATVTINAMVSLATALQWLTRYGTGIFLFMCFVTFVAEDTLLLLENIAVLNRLTVPGRERAQLINQRAKLWELRIKSLSNRSINRSAVESLLADAQQLIKDHDEARRIFKQSRETKASKLASAVRTTAGVVTGGLIPLRRRRNRSPPKTKTPSPRRSLRKSPAKVSTGTSPRKSPAKVSTGTSPRKSPAKVNTDTSPRRNNGASLRRLFNSTQ